MSVVLNLLAVLMLVVHATFGCCWHHAHDAAMDSATAEASDSCCQHHHDDECPCDHSHDSDGSCDHAKCSLAAVVPATTSVAKLSSVTAFWFVPPPTLSCVGCVAFVDGLARPSSASSLSDVPLRLLYGVLRI